MDKLTSRERAMTDSTSFSPTYQEPIQTPNSAPCQCVSCVQGRSRALAHLMPGVDLTDRLVNVLLNGSEEQKAQLKQLLGIE